MNDAFHERKLPAFAALALVLPTMPLGTWCGESLLADELNKRTQKNDVRASRQFSKEVKGLPKERKTEQSCEFIMSVKNREAHYVFAGSEK